MSSALFTCRNLTYCRRLNVNALCRINGTRGFTKCKEMKPNLLLPNQNLAIRRCLSSQVDPESKPTYQPLMEYPEIIWPGFFQMIKCWLYLKLELPSLDREFDLYEFLQGSQQAVCIVSNALSKEDYESLDGLITPEALEILKNNISRMSDEQKRAIALQKKDFVFCFPWTVDIRKSPNTSSKIVEVMMVYHVLPNWEEVEAHSHGQSGSEMDKMDIMHAALANPEYPLRAIICNYRFIRDFGSDDKSWSINLVNQFRLRDKLRFGF